MKACPRGVFVLAFLLFMVCAVPPAAAGGPQGHELAVVDLRGDVGPGGQLKLYIKPGPAATASLRIFSEPSHTLLAVVMDPGFASQPRGKALLEEQEGAAVVVTDLPQGQPALQVAGRPAGDDRIAVYVTGASGEEQLAADARVGGGAFHFSTALVEGGGFRHCCQGGPCGEVCTGCRAAAFTCCLTETCCEAVCGQGGSCCK